MEECSIRMTLRRGAHQDLPLQQEWKARGDAAFRCEVPETLQEDAAALLVPDLLKDAKRRWMAELGAAGLL
jgi:hypothetical protein